MAVTGLDAANYLVRATSTLWDGSFPLFINLWQWRPQNSAQGDGLGIGVAAGDQEFRLRVNNGNTIVQDVDGGLVRTAGAGLQAPDQTWFAQQGQSFGGADFRQVWLNAANNDSDASAVGDISPTELRIGRSLFGSAFMSDWAIAEGSAWDSTGLSQTDLNNLASLLTNGGSGGNGANPLDVNEEVGQPWTGRLRAYWRLETENDLTDLSGNGHDLSIVGTTISTFATHPPVDPVPAVPISKDTVVPLEALKTIVKVAGTRRDTALVFSDDFTGTTGAPLDPTRWEDATFGNALAEIDNNRAALTVRRVGDGDVRLHFLDAQQNRLVLINPSDEFLVELPPINVIGDGSWSLRFNCRTDGLWADVNGGPPHDPNNGYVLGIDRDEPTGDIGLFIARIENGTNVTFIGPGFAVPNGSSISQANVRIEVVGHRLRMILRDVNDGPLPVGEWDVDEVDDTFASGELALTVRAQAGGTLADRTGFIDDVAVSEVDVIGGTPFEALAGVRHDRVIPIESEGTAVISRDRVTPFEALTLLELADTVALEALRSLTRDRPVSLESRSLITRDREVPFESRLSLARDRPVPFESRSELTRVETVPLESLISPLRDRVVPFESGGAPVISRDALVPIESALEVLATRLVPLETRTNIIRDIDVTLEARAVLARDRAVPFELFAVLLAREIEVPFEAEGQIVVPPLEIELIETAQPLTVRLITTLQALRVLLLEPEI